MWHLQKIAIIAHLSKIYMIIPYNAMVISLNTSFSEKKRQNYKLKNSQYEVGLMVCTN